MPSRSMNAPKSVRFLTAPETVSPTLTPVEELLALFAALLLDELAAAEDDVLPVVVDLDDLEVVGVADELLEILRRDDVDLRGGQERFDADVDHEAAFDDGLDLAFDQPVAGEDSRNLVPILVISGLLPSRERPCLIVLEALEEHFHFVADFHGLDVLELGRRNDALRFVADIDEDFSRANLENASFDDATFFELAHRSPSNPAFATHIYGKVSPKDPGIGG